MSLPPLTGVTELGKWLGHSLTGDEAARAGAVLTGVSALVRSEAGRTWVVPDSDPATLATVPDDVLLVVKDVARRMMLNPDGFSSERQGDYGYSVPTAVVQRYLRADQAAVLHRHRTRQRGLWTLGTTRNDPVADTAYVPVVGTDTPFPWYAGDVQ